MMFSIEAKSFLSSFGMPSIERFRDRLVSGEHRHLVDHVVAIADVLLFNSRLWATMSAASGLR
jgi:hypothetical protein